MVPRQRGPMDWFCQFGHSLVGWFAVIGAVRHDGVDVSRGLVQQRADLACIAFAAGSQSRGDNGAGRRVDRQMELPLVQAAGKA
ncbi:hypothetical protein SAE02_71840 [Skermanella aerolata]|uniref:Uncharacterized protein n=1 Tax=Skermanella aerolata TaxID=393310 RepID=A0A512E2Y4_9PROT|nr:hypothetical protein N826_10945 [Skermanella aerolata KACC 11604]GEO43036.1 hypothetical protein SAE02_71840 [Skermanella aerolata]